MRHVTVSALLGLLLVGMFTSTATAKAGDQAAIVGSWQLAFKQASGNTTPHLATFISDGTYVGADPVVTPGANGPLYTSGAHGAWATTGDSVSVTFWELLTDGKGATQAEVLVDASVVVGGPGDSLDGTYYVQVDDPTGKEVGSGSGTVTGSRIVVQPIPSPAASPSAP